MLKEKKNQKVLKVLKMFKHILEYFEEMSGIEEENWLLMMTLRRTKEV